MTHARSVSTFDSPRTLPESALEALRSKLHGVLLRPGADGYDGARSVFNAMVDRRPLLIARCGGAADVVEAVRFARDHDLRVSVRGGGHNVAGSAVCDGGLMIDLSAMKGVRVDPERRRALAEGGATWGDFDRETQAFGLASTGGIVPSTGVGGLTLGGGIGYLNRKYGLACDNLVSAQVVTADARLLKASENENPDLFWGLRGGGGNFGVVTSFEFQVHPVGPVLGGEIIYPLERAKEVLRFYRDWSIATPDEMRADAALLTGPEGAALGIIICYCGDPQAGERLLQPLRQIVPPIADTVAAVPYATVQNLLTEVLAPGFHHYWKSSFFRELHDDAIERLVDFFMADPPSFFTAVPIEHLGGAAARVGEQDTAFRHRKAQHSFLVLRAWRDAAESERNVAWVRACYAAAEPFLEQGVYVNYLGDEGEARTRAAYGPNYERLVAVKNAYDPTNFFRLNQNVTPARGESKP